MRPVGVGVGQAAAVTFDPNDVQRHAAWSKQQYSKSEMLNAVVCPREKRLSWHFLLILWQASAEPDQECLALTSAE